MHELSICRSLIELINAEAKEKGFQTVLEIELRVGEFSGLVPDCIREFFPYAAGGTVAENAELKIESVPAAFKCLDCGYEGAVDRKSARCPSCQSQSIKMTAGREFFVESLKVN